MYANAIGNDSVKGLQGIEINNVNKHSSGKGAVFPLSLTS
jgi:hypothetical protein